MTLCHKLEVIDNQMANFKSEIHLAKQEGMKEAKKLRNELKGVSLFHNQVLDSVKM